MPGPWWVALVLALPALAAFTVWRMLRARNMEIWIGSYLRRRVLPEEANRIHDLGEPALEFPRENERFYPQGSMAAHVLGFVGADGHGRVGMEQVFDEALNDPARRGTPPRPRPKCRRARR